MKTFILIQYSYYPQRDSHFKSQIKAYQVSDFGLLLHADANGNALWNNALHMCRVTIQGLAVQCSKSSELPLDRVGECCPFLSTFAKHQWRQHKMFCVFSFVPIFPKCMAAADKQHWLFRLTQIHQLCNWPTRQIALFFISLSDPLWRSPLATDWELGL